MYDWSEYHVTDLLMQFPWARLTQNQIQNQNFFLGPANGEIGVSQQPNQ